MSSFPYHLQAKCLKRDLNPPAPVGRAPVLNFLLVQFRQCSGGTWGTCPTSRVAAFRCYFVVSAAASAAASFCFASAAARFAAISAARAKIASSRAFCFASRAASRSNCEA